MHVNFDRIITIGRLLDLANALKSEHGENPEYDRALVELCTDAAGLSMDLKDTVAGCIGVKLDHA